MADPYADLTADLQPAKDPYADLISDLPAVKSAPGLAESVRSVQARPELQPINSLIPKIPDAKSGALRQIVDSMKQVAGFPLRVGATLNQVPDVVGQGISDAGLAAGYPKTGAAIGTAVSMAPLAVGLGEGGAAVDGLLRSSENPAFVRGMANTPKMLSPEYDELLAGSGVSKNLPETRGSIPKFPDLAGQPSKNPPVFAPQIAPSSYPRDPNTFLNFARQRIESLGSDLSPQELSDYKTLIGQHLDQGSFGSGKPFAMASQLKSQASSLLEHQVAGLADLNKAYAISTKLRDPVQFLPNAIQGLVRQYGPWLGRAAAATAGIKIGRSLSQ